MIGHFARLHRGATPRLDEDATTTGAPPARFVHKVADEGGDVYLSPLLEAMLAGLRARRRGEHASSDAPETAKRASRTEGA